MAFTTDIKQADADGYATGLAWRDNTTPGGPWYNRGTSDPVASGQAAHDAWMAGWRRGREDAARATRGSAP